MQKIVAALIDKTSLLRLAFFAPFQSIAFASSWLIYGFALVAALLHFAKVDYSRSFTIFVYAVPAASLLITLIRSSGSKFVPNKIDLAFAIFLSLVVFRAAFVEEDSNLFTKNNYFNYMSAMVVMPYLLGRMMRLRDAKFFRMFCLVFGLLMLLFTIIDLAMTVGRHWRWSVFGLSHGPLVVAGIMCVTLITLCYTLLSRGVLQHKQYPNAEFYFYATAIGIVVVLLVILSVRGWFLASVFGVATITFFNRTRTPAFRTFLFLYVLVVAAICFVITPVSSFYLETLDIPAPAPAPAYEGCPILGQSSCQPFKEGNNSVAMRWVLFREAFSMFMKSPFWGVGPTHFGDCSCLGLGWYPHSTLMQALAELGLLGGGCLLWVWLLAVKTLVKPHVISKSGEFSEDIYSYVLAILVSFILADQIYGNYLMSVGTWMTVGISASLFNHIPREASRRHD